ncbi:hypothetical protein OpiT1DRAFT_04796 [Opitutaceae bacterium TAV1]|nr:hypothetical protein OPIT5_25410 [Opitutaceae bacterium TAV5]EIQ00254.1 hypothetical protein OpiT1DRAFT_04796 [Opitutaceae bacterium TAV1]
MRPPVLRCPLRLPVFISGIAALAGLFLTGCSERGEPLPVDTYLRSTDNLLGNRYTLDAEIDAQLNWKEGTGRLIAVRPLNGTRNAATRVPVFIADALNANLMVAQRYRFEITVQKGGLLYVTSLKKL